MSKMSVEKADPKNGDGTNSRSTRNEREWKIPFTSASISAPLLLTYSLSLLYNISFFIQMIILPYLAKQLEISDTDIGLIQTFFGVLQMIGGPIFGFLIRRFGIRKALILCYTSTIISSLLKFTAQSKFSLYVSIIPSIFMHGQQAHQTLLSMITTAGKERTNAFGRMGITFGLGFVFTPLFTIITKKLFSENAPLITSALISSMAIYIALVQLELHNDNVAKKKNDESEQDRQFSLSILVEMAKREGVALTFSKKAALITPLLLVFSIMQVHLINEFHVTSEISSLLQMLSGLFIMLFNGFVVVWLRKRFNERILMILGAVAVLLSHIFMTQWFALWMVFVTLPMICFGMSMVNTVADSLLTSQVHTDEQALILGTSQAVNSLVRTFGPALAGYMLEQYGFAIFGLIGAAITIIFLTNDLFAMLNSF